MRPKETFAFAVTAFALAGTALAADPAPRYELRLLTSVLEPTPQRYSNVSNPVLSPDGAAVMYGVRGTGHIIQRRLENLKLILDFDAGIRYMNWVDWLEDGGILACGYGSKRWSTGFARLLAEWPEGEGFAMSGDFQRAGGVEAEFVSSSSSNRKTIPGWIRLRNLRGEKINIRWQFDQESEKGDLSTDRYGVQGGIAPHGSHVIVHFDGQRREVGIWKDFDRLVAYTVPGLQPVAVRNFKPKEQTPRGEHFVFTPDGKSIALQVGDPEAIAIYTVPGLQRTAALPYDDGSHPLNFSPDGRLLAICAHARTKPGELTILDVADWSVVVSTAAGGCSTARFTTDGRRLVTTGGGPRWDGKSDTIPEQISVWELKERHVPGDASPSAAPAFSGAVPLLR